MDATELYIRIGRLIEAMPPLNAESVLSNSPDIQRWFGEAYALTSVSGEIIAATEIKMAIDKLSANAGMGGVSIDRMGEAARAIPVILYRILAVAELKAPPEYRGSFIPAQTPFEALAAFAKVFKHATHNVLIVDPYLDANALYDFAVINAEGVTVQLLAGSTTVKPGLKPAVTRWVNEYQTKRPLDVKIADAALLHDRLVITDNNQVWLLSQSLGHFATRSPATIVRFDDEGNAKRTYYESLWGTAAAF